MNNNGTKYRDMKPAEFRVAVGLTLEDIKKDFAEFGEKLNAVCRMVGEHDKDIAVIKSEYGQLARDLIDERHKTEGRSAAVIRGRAIVWAAIVGSLITTAGAVACAAFAYFK